MANRLDTNKQNIIRWSAGDRKLTVEWAKKLAPLLDTRPDVLLLVSDAGFGAVPGIRSAGRPSNGFGPNNLIFLGISPKIQPPMK